MIVPANHELVFRESADRRVLQLRCEDRGAWAAPVDPSDGVLSMGIEAWALRTIVLRSKPFPGSLQEDLRGAVWQLRLALLLLTVASGLAFRSAITAIRRGSSGVSLDSSPYRDGQNREEAQEGERRRASRVRRCVAGVAVLVASAIGLVAVARGAARRSAPMYLLQTFSAGSSEGREQPVAREEGEAMDWPGHGMCGRVNPRQPGERRPAATGGPTIRARLPTVSGPLSSVAIRRVVLRSLGQVNHCYERGLAEHPRLTGRVVVRFVSGGTGAVVTSNVASSSIPVASVGECIAAAVTRWQFPASADGGRVTVSYPFDFLVE